MKIALSSWPFKLYKFYFQEGQLLPAYRRPYIKINSTVSLALFVIVQTNQNTFAPYAQKKRMLR